MRAFSTFLELANLAEDRQRVRTLRRREEESHPHPVQESIPAAIESLRERDISAGDVQALLNRIHVELVFTAHPTEAKRKSLRSKLRAIRELLARIETPGLLSSEHELLGAELRGELIKLWQTDFIRPSRPTVSLEVHRGLSFQPVLWATVPKVFRELREATAENFPDVPIEIPEVLSFGSWMGGDRDGHPFVTPEITAQTCQWLRSAAIEKHLEVRRELADSLSISRRKSPACERLEERIAMACDEWPELVSELEGHGILESYRRWLRVIRWRLEQTAAVELNSPAPKALSFGGRIRGRCAGDSRRARGRRQHGSGDERSADVARPNRSVWISHGAARYSAARGRLSRSDGRAVAIGRRDLAGRSADRGGAATIAVG